MSKLPDTRSEPFQVDELQRQMDALASRVPRHAIRAVIDEIDRSGAPPGSRAAAMRDALIEQFNRLRPLKARRLFTGLFEPLLVDDPVLYRARETIPGLVQRVDIGGVWGALARLAFPKLAMDVQARLDEMSRDAVLDRVLNSPEALVMRTVMAGEAARFFASLPANRKAVEEFLAIANREAMADARRRTASLTFKAPIDLSLLYFLQAVLEDGHRLLPLLTRLRGDLAERPASSNARDAEVDGQAALLVGYGRELRTLCPGRSAEHPVVWCGPLMALNIARRYDVVQRFLREHAGPGMGDRHPVHEALFGHFSACCVTLVELVRSIFADAVVDEAAELSLARSLRPTLEETLTRFDRSLNALVQSGLLASKSVGPRVRPLLAAVAQTLTGTVLPVIEDRVARVAALREEPEGDQADLLWLVDFVWMWSASLAAVGYAGPEVNALKGRILEACHAAYLQAVRFHPEDDPADRMEHVLRINRLLTAVGESVAPWLSAVSQGMQRIVRHYLDEPDPPSEEARFIIGRFAGALRSELTRTRNWQSADLVALLRDYEASGW